MTEGHKPMNAIIPGLGWRSIKTALSAVLVALVYYFIGRNPTFACIGAIFGTGSDMEDSKKNGGNRLIGTVIGGFIGIGVFWLEHLFFPEGNYLFRLPLLAVGIIILVCASVIFKWPGAVQPGGVVLCIILFYTPDNHIMYAIARMIDTAVGVIVAIAMNSVLPRHRCEKLTKLTGITKKQDELS